MNTTDLREAIAAALVGVNVDWPVLEAPVDNLDPPAYMVQHGPAPWLTIDTTCTDMAQVEVIAVAARLTPEANYPTLEQMVDGARAALFTARFRPYQVLPPAPFEIGQVTYLAARLQIRRPVETGGQ